MYLGFASPLRVEPPTLDPAVRAGRGPTRCLSHPVSHLLHGRGRTCGTERHGIVPIRAGWTIVGVLPRLRSPVRTRSSAPLKAQVTAFSGRGFLSC